MINPHVHCNSYARLKESEIKAVKDQIKFAKETNFKSILHIVHVPVMSYRANKKSTERNENYMCRDTAPYFMG